MKTICNITLATSLWLVMMAPALAAYQPIDSVIATVENEAITQSDLEQKIRLVKQNFSAQKQALPPENEIRKQVLDRLIIESLQLQMAEKSGLKISDERLAQAMGKIAERKGISEEQFRAQLEKENIPYEAMREQIRKDMTLQQLQQSRLRHKIQISEQEVGNYLESVEGKKLTATRYRMSHIMLELDENASPETVAASKKALASVRTGIQQGDYAFADIVAGKTVANLKLQGAQLDWLADNELPSLFASQLQHLHKGDISVPVRSGAGWHLIMLNDIEGGSNEIVHQISARHILVKPSEVRSNKQAQQLANDLYTRLKNGEDFALLAKEYSEDPGSALQGGNLGWSKPSQYVPAFANTLNALGKGETSPPFESPFGWHIVQKLDERDHDMTQENRKNQAYQAIYERKFAEELENWLITLREESFVEIRN